VLARLGSAGARKTGSAGLRALLSHRTAFAAARLRDQPTAHDALLVAQRLADKIDPTAEPSWLYWLDPTELAAMTGRTLVVLGRPMRALTLLDRAQRSATLPPPDTARQPRTTALRSSWLARALLDVGELEHACVIGHTALLDTVRSGSIRAATHTRELAARLGTHQGMTVARDLSDLISRATPYLPGARMARSRSPIS
jgi:hypothetical protein